LNQCDPNADGADEKTGCTITFRDDECDDGASCSDNECRPADTNRDDQSGCVDTYYDTRCADDNVCSDDFCRPDQIDDQIGCVSEANTAPCDDGDECTGTVEVPDQCADFECVSGAMVCPYVTGEVFAGQFFPAGNVVMTNNETHVLLRWNAGDSGWTTNVIHVYVDTEAPSKLSPGRFTKIVTLAAPVSELLMAVPLPNACNLDGSIYFAFHIEAISGTGSPICILRNGNTECSGLTETGWFKGEYQPPKSKNWGSYAQFDACCCAGFSHVESFLMEDSSVEVLYSISAKAAMSTPEEVLVLAIADLLEIPFTAVRVVSYDMQSNDLEDAVIRFLDVDNVSGGTLARELTNIPASAFASYGIQVDSLVVVPSSMDNAYVNVEGNLYSSFESDSSSAGALICSVMLSLLLILL